VRRHSGVVRETQPSRLINVRDISNGLVQLTADMDIVVQVTDSGSSDPAVRLGRQPAELVCWREAKANEVVVHRVLVWKEAGQARLVLAAYDVVVAEHQHAIAKPGRQSGDAGHQRGDEGALALNLRGRSIARRDVNT
jgi:hypothetical protein